jgi:hypothetical protein
MALSTSTPPSPYSDRYQEPSSNSTREPLTVENDPAYLSTLSSNSPGGNAEGDQKSTSNPTKPPSTTETLQAHQK